MNKQSRWISLTKKYYTGYNVGWRIEVSIGYMKGSNTPLLALTKQKTISMGGAWKPHGKPLYLSEEYWKDIFTSTGVIPKVISEFRESLKNKT